MGHDVTRFFPLFFEAYIALSAESSSVSAVGFSIRSFAETPTLAVTGMSPPAFASSMALLIRSAVPSASSVEKSGSIAANSSPPQR